MCLSGVAPTLGTFTVAFLGGGQLAPGANSHPSAQGAGSHTWLPGRQLITAEMKPAAALYK
ncbi:hypothetical protein [Kitasatospora sp. NPDC059327]|uniref:hypothetical protein n=1 Tax=Kitasatospora sp. NPDC059327 TaxID=3346803 RepID=UPI0036C9B9E8